MKKKRPGIAHFKKILFVATTHSNGEMKGLNKELIWQQTVNFKHMPPLEIILIEFCSIARDLT